MMCATMVRERSWSVERTSDRTVRASQNLEYALFVRNTMSSPRKPASRVWPVIGTSIGFRYMWDRITPRVISMLVMRWNRIRFRTNERGMLRKFLNQSSDWYRSPFSTCGRRADGTRRVGSSTENHIASEDDMGRAVPRRRAVAPRPTPR